MSNISPPGSPSTPITPPRHPLRPCVTRALPAVLYQIIYSHHVPCETDLYADLLPRIRTHRRCLQLLPDHTARPRRSRPASSPCRSPRGSPSSTSLLPPRCDCLRRSCHRWWNDQGRTFCGTRRAPRWDRLARAGSGTSSARSSRVLDIANTGALGRTGSHSELLRSAIDLVGASGAIVVIFDRSGFRADVV